MSEDKDKSIKDSDADGLTDSEEKMLGTNPHDPDTDHDELGDYQEVKVYHTDPLDADSDCDGKKDGQEVKAGQNPLGSGSLRNLFIPNECNDFRPHSLHPKRLAFHALAALMIKLVMVAFALSFPVQAWLSPDILAEQAGKIVELTNNIRSQLGIDSLRENELLSAAALNKAEDMLINEYFAHLGPDNRSLRNWLYDEGYNFSVAGENLAMGFSSPEAVVDAWVNSETHYANLIDSDFQEIGVGVVSGDYQGDETTLIAQYFGTRQAVAPAQPEEEPAPQPEPQSEYNAKIEQASAEIPAESETEPVSESPSEAEPDEPVTMPAENIETIQAPVLISPENQAVLSDSLNLLTISAPDAQVVAIYDNNELITKKNLTDSQIELPLKLADGEHNIEIVSYLGSQEAKSLAYQLTVDTTPPLIDHQKSEVLVNQPANQDSIVIKASVYLSQDTKSAELNFGDYSIELSPGYTQDGEWSGAQVISGLSYDELFNPIVMATVRAEDEAGNVLLQDIEWSGIEPAVGSTVSQYFFVKKHPSEYIKPLFNIGNLYYKILLGLLALALLLTIFVEFRKQHPKTIISATGVIVFIALLTIL